MIIVIHALTWIYVQCYVYVCTCTQADPSSSDSASSLLKPEVMQSYLQMLYQQSEAEGGGGGGGGGDSGDSASNLMATSTLLQQVHVHSGVCNIDSIMQPVLCMSLMNEFVWFT